MVANEKVSGRCWKMWIAQKIRLPRLSIVVSVGSAMLLCTYFAYYAVKGDYGTFRRIQINDEAIQLQRELDQLNGEIRRMQKLTYRLSDEFLDLDLLDERARAVLGYIRVDEIIIN